jgi:hypothetical protein
VRLIRIVLSAGGESAGPEFENEAGRTLILRSANQILRDCGCPQMAAVSFTVLKALPLLFNKHRIGGTGKDERRKK